MKTVITLLTFLISMTIGLTTSAENLIISAVDQTTIDEHVTTAPIPVSVPAPVISTEENEDIFAVSSDVGC